MRQIFVIDKYIHNIKFMHPQNKHLKSATSEVQILNQFCIWYKKMIYLNTTLIWYFENANEFSKFIKISFLKFKHIKSAMGYCKYLTNFAYKINYKYFIEIQH